MVPLQAAGGLRRGQTDDKCKDGSGVANANATANANGALPEVSPVIKC